MIPAPLDMPPKIKYFQRNTLEPTLEDHCDKSVLPSVMQVKVKSLFMSCDRNDQRIEPSIKL